MKKDVQKVGGSIAVMKRIKHFVPDDILLTIYRAMIHHTLITAPLYGEITLPI